MYKIDPAYVEFVKNWHQIMYILSGLSLALSLGIWLYHKMKVAGIKTYKGKYDYIRQYQVRHYQYAVFAFAAALFFYGNTLGDATIVKSIVYLFVRLFISLCAATLVAYVMYLILKFYYPGKLEKKLRKLRYAPRISSAGNEMKLLSEEEEDVHLDAGMQMEENVFSVDYDVWVDEKTGEVKIEKYPGYLEAQECGSCGFMTMKIESEEIVKPATETEEGELIRHFKCKYCGAERHTKYPIAKIIKSEAEYKLPQDYVLKGQRKVKSIMIEIISTKGDKKEYFFQDTKQASEFLAQFDFDKEP